MNLLPVFIVYLEVVLLAFAEKKLWNTWFTPINCLSVPYALVLAVCLCVNGNMGFAPFYFSSIWVWVVGLAVFFIPSCVLGLRNKKQGESKSVRPEMFSVSPKIMRFLEYVTWVIFALFVFHFFRIKCFMGYIPGGERFASAWASHGFFGHLYTVLMGLNVLWVFAADKNHKRYWLYVIGFFVVALLYLVKCWFLTPMAAGLLLRLITGKSKFGFKIAFISIFVGFAFFFLSYWMVLYVAASEKAGTNEQKKQEQKASYQAEVTHYIGKHAVTYMAAGVYGLSEDLAQNTLEKKDARKIYAPFINIGKLLGDRKYVSNLNDKYISITSNDLGSNVRSFFGSVYIHMGLWQAIAYTFILSCLCYLLFAFTLKRGHLLALTIVGWIQSCLLMGWFDITTNTLNFITIPVFLMVLFGFCFWWQNNHDKLPKLRYTTLRKIRWGLAFLQTISLTLLVSLFWLPFNVPSYFLGISAGIAFAFLLTLPRRAINYRFLKPCLSFLLLYALFWISALYSDFPEAAFNRCCSQISILLIPFIFLGMTPLFFSQKRINLFVICFSIGCLLLIIANVAHLFYCFQFVKPYFEQRGYIHSLGIFLKDRFVFLRWIGMKPFMHTTVEALTLNLAFALGFIARVQNHPWLKNRCRKCLADICLLFFMVALFFSSSKTGLCLFAINTLVLAGFAFVKNRKKIVLVFCTVMAGICLIASNHYFDIGIGKRFQQSVKTLKKISNEKTLPMENSEFIKERSFLPRIYCWETALKMIEEKPVFGYGAGAKENFKEQFKLDYPHYFWEYNHPHSQFLYVFLTTGVIGLLVFLLFLVQAIHLVWQNHRLWGWCWFLGLFLFCCIDIISISTSLFYTFLPYCFLMVSHYNRQKACGTSRDIRKLAN